MSLPKAGDILLIGRAASVQFVRPMLFRLIRVREDWVTYDGWTWLDGYELDKTGDAVSQRSIFVLKAGMRVVRLPARKTVAGVLAPVRVAGDLMGGTIDVD